jgi:hypothetical protein
MRSLANEAQTIFSDTDMKRDIHLQPDANRAQRLDGVFAPIDCRTREKRFISGKAAMA